MIKHIQKVLLLGTLFFASIVSAKVHHNTVITQEPTSYPIQNNATVQISLSYVDMNRITVTNDKISSIHCPSGYCVLSKKPDSSGGALLSLTKNEPFTFYVDTQKGNHFGVIAIPRSTTGKTVNVYIEGVVDKEAIKKQNSLPYENMLTALVKDSIVAFENNTVPRGYTEFDCYKYKPSKHGALRFKPIKIFNNGNNNVVIFKVTNLSKHSKKIRPNLFYARGLKALSIMPNITVISPHQSVQIIEVVGAEGEIL